LIERVKALHSYSVPCVLAWPIEAGNEAYIDWLCEQTEERMREPA
jgi:periplasmic divalent cation tolerance protein